MCDRTAVAVGAYIRFVQIFTRAEIISNVLISVVVVLDVKKPKLFQFSYTPFETRKRCSDGIYIILYLIL